MSHLLRQLWAALVILVLIGGTQSYFAFPRQGRAMSFYFPRMGRSGADAEKAAEAGYCCAEGVRRVVTAGERIYETCKPEHSCCRGLNEIKKNYKDISITECAVDDSLDQIRAYIGND